ncbi:hypothetical protein FAF44_51175 [Nonomuraea sp. MG754425]|uniref:hypothetical protein n=1 Tax=Nonomuraea sp. MG754425 TaxID=2570319 RepID=UPI001F396E9C|nr:hypothetical protein [Nonomuraea sp. MG754425]MCF6476641.1 hypothetical protein [Nonomuraea sp. MG754425]
MRKTLALAVAAVALAGCGMIPGQQGGGGEERQSQTATAEGQSASAPTSEPASEPSAGQGEQSAPPQQQGAPIASHEAEVSSGGMSGKGRIEITSLKRQGRTLTLNWTVTATDGKVNLHNGLSGGTLDYTVSAVSLIDPVNAKRYRTARNGTGENATCVCSRTQGQFLESGAASTLYAVFAAPPADVTRLNVEMPMFGVLTDVPIS